METSLLLHALFCCIVSSLLMLTSKFYRYFSVTIQETVVIVFLFFSCFEKFRAAYKGFADSIRLLLFLDAYRGRQDKEGGLQT